MTYASDASSPLGLSLEEILDAPDRFTTDVSDGTLRVRPLQHTLGQLWESRDEYGVSRVCDITRQDEIGIPVFSATRPCADEGNLTVSAGKGTSRTAALVSCLAEAFERHWAEPGRHRSVIRQGSADEIRSDGSRVLTPPQLGMARGAPYDRRTPLKWLECSDLATGLGIWVPCDYLLAPVQSPFTLGASDGIAAGNTIAEAMLHGTLELIERDACSFGTWLGLGCKLDNSSVPFHVRDIMAEMVRHDLEPTLYQFPSIAEIPVVYATIVDHRRRSPMFICAGAGAHLDARIACSRALTEALQSRACVLSGSREDLEPKYQQIRERGFDAVLRELRAWDARMPRVPLVAPSENQNATPGQAVRELVALLDRRGFQVVARLLSPLSAPLATVSVVVVGAESVESERSPMGSRFRRALKTRLSNEDVGQ